jgi:hypothetical protein
MLTEESIHDIQVQLMVSHQAAWHKKEVHH